MVFMKEFIRILYDIWTGALPPQELFYFLVYRCRKGERS